MDDVSGGNVSMTSHTLSKQDWGLNNGDVSCANGFINNHTLYQCNEQIYFNDMDGNVENGDVRGEYFFMNSHIISEANKQISLDY